MPSTLKRSSRDRRGRPRLGEFLRLESTTSCAASAINVLCQVQESLQLFQAATCISPLNVYNLKQACTLNHIPWPVVGVIMSDGPEPLSAGQASWSH